MDLVPSHTRPPRRWGVFLVAFVVAVAGTPRPLLASGTTPCAGGEPCDADGDGFTTATGDCDDTRWAVSPAAAEVPANRLDDNCNGRVDETDSDQDGSPDPQDCDDLTPTVHPGAAEASNGRDDDCDGAIDEGVRPTDADGDGYAASAGDCDDRSADRSPGATEAPDGVDEDCDGHVDEGTVAADDDGDGYCEGVRVSGAGGMTTTCFDGASPGDCHDGAAGVHPGATDGANGIDDDCDGQVDGVGASPVDVDGDGVSAGAGDCDDTDPRRGPGTAEAADGVDQDCDGQVDEGTSGADDDGDGASEAAGDCNDADAAVHPGATDPPNGRDDDCDGALDEGSPAVDDDGDGLSEDQGDCDDTAAAISPALPELPLNGADDNCDGRADEQDGFETVDQDQDGSGLGEGDCDDLDASVHPNAEEACDGLDTNCDGVVDAETCGGVSPTGACDTAGGGAAPSMLLLAAALLWRRRGAAGWVVGLGIGIGIGLGGCGGSDVSVQQPVGRLSTVPEDGVVELGPINLGEVTAGSVYVFNAGGGAVDVASVRLDGDGADAFTLDAGFSGTVAIGEGFDLPVSFRPARAGTFVASLVVSHRAASSDEAGTLTVDLLGRASELSVVAAPGRIDFGPVPAGGELAVPVLLVNRGLAPVTLTEAVVTDPAFRWSFTRQGYTLPWQVEAGGVVELSVVAQPDDAEPHEALLDMRASGARIQVPLVVGRCEGSGAAAWDADGDSVSACAGDCDDTNDAVHPGAPEVADGQDADCDGLTDEGTLAWDDDGDCACEVAPCSGGVFAGCAGLGGGDCDDTASAVFPGAPEYGQEEGAPRNGIDDDCDGGVDDTYGADGDGDGFTEAGGDCDDTDPALSPAAPEAADGIDADCDGAVDEGTGATDDDGDGLCEGADLGTGAPSCADGSQPGDCDDHNPDRSPLWVEGDEASAGGDGAYPAFDGQDNDCDGAVDEGSAPLDGDGDGFSAAAGDCDDTEPAVHPAAAEACDGLDTNCDGLVGWGEVDGDGDGLSACAGDCNDGDAAIHPGATERCDGVDNDCNGLADPPGDADGDGLSNQVEGAGDLDGDGAPNCIDPDADGDGAPDAFEGSSGSDPTDPDTDDDGYTDLVELALGTSPTDPSQNPSVGEDLVYLAPEGEALSPGVQTLAFDTFIQYMDLYWSFDYTSSMRVELNVMRNVDIGVPAIIRELACEPALTCPRPDGCTDGTGYETVPCVENPDCAGGEVCGIDGVCIEHPLTRGCVPDIWSGVSRWDELDSFENLVSLQGDPAATARSIPTTGGGISEAPFQAPACAADGVNCTNNDIDCAATGIGCPGYREEALRVYLQVTDANDQCYGSACSRFTPDYAGRELARQGMRFIGLFGTDDEYDGEGTAEGVARAIGIASGTVNTDGEPYVYRAVDAAVADNTVLAVRDLLRTFPLRVTITAEDQPGDDGDALAFIDHLAANTSGAGRCTAQVGGVPLSVEDDDGDGYGETFVDLLAGTSICWDLHPVPVNTVVQAGPEPQVFHALLWVDGSGAVLNRKDLYVIVPPAIVTPSF